MNIFRLINNFFSGTKVASLDSATSITSDRAGEPDPLVEFEKNISDEKNKLFEIKTDLAKVLADEMGIVREIEKLDELIVSYENNIKKALNNKNEKLAIEISEQISQRIHDKSKKQRLLDNIRTYTKTIKTIINEKESNITAAEFEISSIKTMNNIQTMSSSLTTSFSNNHLDNSDTMFAELKGKWLKQQDYIDTLLELQREKNGDDLLDKLREEGINIGKSSSEEILHKVKEKYHGTIK